MGCRDEGRGGKAGRLLGYGDVLWCAMLCYRLLVLFVISVSFFVRLKISISVS